MAQAAVATGLDISAAGIGAQEEALARLEALADEMRCGRSRGANPMASLRRASRPGAAATSRARANSRWKRHEADETQRDRPFMCSPWRWSAWAICTRRSSPMSAPSQLDPNDPDLLLNLGLDGLEPEADRRRGRRCSISSSRPARIRRWATTISARIQCDMGDPSTAIETLRAAIYRMPTEPMLWNSLATVLAEDGRAEESLVFYQEAIRLEPDFAAPLAQSRLRLFASGPARRGARAYDSALARAVDPTEIIEGTHSRSICLIGMGRLEEGFREYEIRNKPRFRAYVHHMINAPVWNGEPLDGKRLLVVGEQGLGDEFMFANILPDLAARRRPERQAADLPSIRGWSRCSSARFPTPKSAPMTTAS